MKPHLSDQQIQQYSLQQISPGELDAVAAHLAECPECSEKTRQRMPVAAVIRSVWNDLSRQEEGEEEHLGYEQLEGLVDETLNEADREIAESHLEECAQCSAAERELLGMRRELSEPARVIWWRSAAAMTAIAASLTIVFTVALFSLYRQVSTLQARIRSLGEEQAQWESRYRAANDQARDLQSRLAAAQGGSPGLEVKDGNSEIVMNAQGQLSVIKRLNPESQKILAAALSSRSLNFPADLSNVIGQRGILLGPGEKESFTLLTPVGTVVESAQPVLRWTSLPGAESYTVSVYDSEFNPVQKSGALQSTEWKIPAGLNRGKVYAWQVVALRAGQEMKSPMPPAPPASFKVLDAASLAALQEARSGLDSHIAAGILDASYGMLDSAEAEFELASRTGNAELADRFLQQIRSLRRGKSQ